MARGGSTSWASTARIRSTSRSHRGSRTRPTIRTSSTRTSSRRHGRPDGTRLAFHTRETKAPDKAFRIHVATIDPAGAVSDEQTLIFDPAWYNEFFAQWLPDGHGLVFDAEQAGAIHAVRIGDTGGGASRDLTVPSGIGAAFAISPDGTEVAVRPNVSSPVVVSVIDLATGQTTASAFDTDDLVSWQRLARNR